MFPALLRITNCFVDSIQHQCFHRGQPVVMWDFAVRLFFDCMSNVGLGCPRKATALLHPDPKYVPEMLLLFNDIIDLEKERQIRIGSGMGALNALPSRANGMYKKKCDAIYKLASEFVFERQQQLSTSRSSTSTSSPNTADDKEEGEERPPVAVGNFLDACLACPHLKTPSTTTGTMAEAQVLNLFRAGTDTTAACLTWTCIMLSKHPEAEAALIEEIDAVLSKAATSDEIQPQDVELQFDMIDRSEMPYLDAVLKETMRLYPPANVLLRGIDATADLELTSALDPSTVGYDARRYALPAGSRVLVDIISLHRDPRYWQDPDRFCPERFLSAAAGGQEPGQYIPFGGGPRTCIGNLFGLLEVKCAIVQIYRKFRFQNCGEPIVVVAGDEQKPVKGSVLMLRQRGSKSDVASPIAPKQKVIPVPPAASPQGKDTTDSVVTEVEGTTSSPPPTRPLKYRRIVIGFGSNQMTCQGLAQQVAEMLQKCIRSYTQDAHPDDSMEVSTPEVHVASLDEVVGLLTADTEVPAGSSGVDDVEVLFLIICSTYNGAPPKNATRFVSALREKTQSPDSYHRRKAAVHYAVFGVGNQNWGPTFQRIPGMIDDYLANKISPPAPGSAGIAVFQRLLDLAVADTSEGDGSVTAAFHSWLRSLRSVLNLRQTTATTTTEDSTSTIGAPQVDNISVIDDGAEDDVLLNFRTTSSILEDQTKKSDNGVQTSGTTTNVDGLECDFIPHDEWVGESTGRTPHNSALDQSGSSGELQSQLFHHEKGSQHIYTVTAAKDLTGDRADRRVRHLDLVPATFSGGEDCGGDEKKQNEVPCYQYEAGDHLLVECVQSSNDLIARLCSHLHRHPEDKVKLHSAVAGEHVVPYDGVWVSVADVIRHRELKVTTRMLAYLSPLCAVDAERSLFVAASSYGDVFKVAFLERGLLTLVDLLDHFSGLAATLTTPDRQCGITLQHVLLATEPLKPRYYSIASDPMWQSRRMAADAGTTHDCINSRPPMSIVVGVIEGTARSGSSTSSPYFGVASNFLASLHLGDTLRASIVSSTFRLPPQHTLSHVVFVAGGTGIAPFMGFLQQLEPLFHQRRALESEVQSTAGEEEERAPLVTLYFGVRNEGELLYHDILERYAAVEDGRFLKLRVAFSRSETRPKRYVQDLMREDEELLSAIIREKEAHVYVCGGARTVGAGTQQFISTLSSAQLPNQPHLRGEIAPSHSLLETMLDSGRLQLDVWGS